MYTALKSEGIWVFLGGLPVRLLVSWHRDTEISNEGSSVYTSMHLCL